MIDRARLKVLAEVRGTGGVGYCKKFSFQAEDDHTCDAWEPGVITVGEGVEDAPRYRAADTYIKCANCRWYMEAHGAHRPR